MPIRRSFPLIALLSLCLFGLLPGTPLAAPPKHILFINSYHEGYKGTDDIVAGFRSVVNSSLPGSHIKTEYLDSKNYSGAEYDRKLIDLFRYKYRANHFELIVTSDDYAFNFIEKYYDELFAPIPVVFCGTNAFDETRIKGKNYLVGIDESPSFRETIEFGLRLRPGTKKIVVLHDDSLVGQINSDLFRHEARSFANRVGFKYVSGLALEDLTDTIKTLSPDTLAFYFTSVVKDREGESYSSNDALAILSAQSPVPILGGWEFNLGHGILGGKLINLFEHGIAAGRLAVKILTGEPPAALPKLSPSPNLFMFDDRQLQRFDIKDGQLPTGNIIVNRPPTFYQQNRAEIFIALSILLFCLVIGVVVFLYNSRRTLQQSYQVQLDTEKTLRESQASLQQAFDEIKTLRGILPICASCKKIRDDKGYWNQIEQYISAHSEAQFSHSVCPDCARKIYPEFFDHNGDFIEQG